MKKAIGFVTLVVLAANVLYAQNSQKAEPVLPEEVPGLIYIEGEDAVSTNFSSTATLDFASSGLRVLQLNLGPQAPGKPFFAEYAFYVAAAGDYEFWIGGTPPGPKNELLPSYVSPIHYVLDDAAPVTVYREDVHVVESYSVTNYWSVAAAPVKLSQGIHTMRIEVSDKRLYDSRYYFSIDALFFLKTGSANLPPDKLPKAFPKDRANRSIDTPYYSIAQFAANIQANPKELRGYLDFAKTYSLVGDNANALKILQQAKINTGDSPDIDLLLAKNRIWSGELDEGIRLYKEYLKARPGDLAVWAEAAKVSAWLGKYEQSQSLYREGLRNIPGDLDLLVNQGLTFLWANRVNEGEAILGKAWDSAKNDSGTIRELGQIYEVNGYPDKSVETYQKAITAFPGKLEFRLWLQEAFLLHGQNDKAAEIKAGILKDYGQSDELTAYLDTVELKSSIKQRILDEFNAKLAAKPDDLRLREELVQAYYWNGKKDEAVQETINILVNKLYLQFQALDTDLLPSYRALDEIYLVLSYLDSVPKKTDDRTQALRKAYDAWKQASSNLIALAKGKTPQDKIDQATETLRGTEKALAAENTRAQEFARVFAGTDGLIAAIQDVAHVEIDKMIDEVQLIVQQKPWVWDRTATFDELNSASKRGVPLADYLLARLNLLEQNQPSAKKSLSKLPVDDSSPESFKTLVSQAGIWLGQGTDTERLKAGPYFPYASDVIQTASTLAENDVSAPEFADTTAAASEETLKRLSAISQSAQTKHALVAKLRDQLHERVMNRTRIQFYKQDLDTSGLRYQLGNYYLDLSDFKDAKLQLERVMLIEPGNIYAKFNLGRAAQLAGDWSKAMNIYREVYETEPKFENTLNLYNQLAQQHADKIDSHMSAFWDNGRVATHSEIAFQSGGNSILGFSAGFVFDTLRLTNPFVPSVTASLDPKTISLDTLYFAVPVTIQDIGLSAYAKVGGTLDNRFFSNEYLTAATHDIGEVFSEAAVAPLASLGLEWSAGPLNLAGSYAFDQIQDTFFPFRQVFYEHRAEATATLFFAFPAPAIIQSLGSRSYGKLAGVFSPFEDTTNTLYSLVQELNVNFQLGESAGVLLTVSGLGSYEDSANETETNYYAPKQVAIGKGMVRLSTKLNIDKEWFLGLTGRFGAGVNNAPANSTENKSLFLGEGELRFDLGKEDVTLFLDLFAGLTTDGNTLSYWALNADMGLHIAVPGYLVPK